MIKKIIIISLIALFVDVHQINKELTIPQFQLRYPKAPLPKGDEWKVLYGEQYFDRNWNPIRR